jgi:hypothetical protein
MPLLLVLQAQCCDTSDFATETACDTSDCINASDVTSGYVVDGGKSTPTKFERAYHLNNGYYLSQISATGNKRAKFLTLQFSHATEKTIEIQMGS